MSFLSVQLLEPKNGLKVLKNALGLIFKSFDLLYQYFLPTTIHCQPATLKLFDNPVPGSLRASSPIWASEASLARTHDRAALPRGAEERRACNDLSQNFICTSLRRREITLAEKRRSGKQR